jgi:hypothetical protein
MPIYQTSGNISTGNSTYELELTVGSDQRTISGSWAVIGID